MKVTLTARLTGLGIADATGSFVTRAVPELPLMPGFVKAAMHKRGLVGWVERAGLVRVGDAVNIWEDVE